MALEGGEKLAKARKKPHLLKLTEAIESFGKDEVVQWKCRNCGCVHQGTEAPKKYPACTYPLSYYEVMEKNYYSSRSGS